MSQSDRRVSDWVEISRRIADAARAAVSLHIDGCVRDAAGRERSAADNLEGTQAEGLLVWLRERAELQRGSGIPADLTRGVAR